jgi:hypothetical protein
MSCAALASITGSRSGAVFWISARRRSASNSFPATTYRQAASNFEATVAGMVASAPVRGSIR